MTTIPSSVHVESGDSPESPPKSALLRMFERNAYAAYVDRMTCGKYYMEVDAVPRPPSPPKSALLRMFERNAYAAYVDRMTCGKYYMEVDAVPRPPSLPLPPHE